MEKDISSGQRERAGRRPGRWVLITALAIAFAVAVGSYTAAAAGTAGAIGYTVLVILPAALSAFVAWVGSMGRNWPRSTFALVPVWLSVGVAVIGAVAFREGIVCILMLLPLWLLFGMLGVWPVYQYRKQSNGVDSSIFRANALLLLPLLSLVVDQHVAPPTARYHVVREISVAAPPEAVWPQLLAIPDIDAAEGVWTVSQSLLGLPRPTGAKLTGRGEGAVRDAEWEGGVRFREIVTRWQPDRALQWRFSFPDASIRLRTDEHIDPHGRHLWIESGGYDLIPMQDGGTKIRLWTRYRAATPLNAYAAMWGEMILGDIQNNVLAIVAGRIAREKDHE